VWYGDQQPQEILHAVAGDTLTVGIWVEPPAGEYVDQVSLWVGVLPGSTAITGVHPLVGRVDRAEVLNGEAWLEIGDAGVDAVTLVAELTLSADDYGQSCLASMPLAGAMAFGIEPCVQVEMLGDLDANLAVTGLDVAPFVDAVYGGEYVFTADMNRDGIVNGLDVQPFIDVLLGISPVPEPDGIVTILVLLMCASRSRLTMRHSS
jgi:hypothetical protein